MPILMVGLVNRTKSWWGGRRGPKLSQSFWDLARLLRKQPVFSSVTTPLFRAGAWVVLVASLLAAQIAPMLGAFAPLQFSHDFIVFAYVLGLARLFLMLSAMDVGSSFEGMGAAREASFTAFIEPALFLLVGTAALGTGQTSLAGAIGHWQGSAAHAWLAAPAVLVLFVLLQAEAARVPVDDPLTHLELTMIHEVMVLDHSGPELAAMQYAAAVKMTLVRRHDRRAAEPGGHAGRPAAGCGRVAVADGRRGGGRGLRRIAGRAAAHALGAALPDAGLGAGGLVPGRGRLDRGGAA